MKKQKMMMAFMMSIIFITTHAQNTEWENLFNGKSLKGWKTINGAAEYIIEDGCITGISKENTTNTFLTTGKKYINFVLEYEMRMDEGLNSGVQIRSNSIDTINKGQVFGLQVECDDSKRCWTGGLYDEARKAWRYPLEYNPAAKIAYKNNQWNKFKIIAFENRIVTFVNDIVCANLFEEEVESGFIALQIHEIYKKENAGKKIQWRNIRIKTSVLSDIQALGVVVAPEVSYLKNALTDNEIKNGWKLLWDGASTNGWRGAKLENFPSNGWQIKNGELSVLKSNGGESTNGGDIVTTKKYKNFELQLDFKITEGANSGIKYFVNTELNKGLGSSIGCEFQILDDKNHPDAKLGVNGNRTIGSVYDLITANAKIFNPNLPNEKYLNGMQYWNKARIIVNGSKVEHYLNGCKVIEYDRSTQMWRALVAYSKYRDWTNFGEAEEGNILLQDHGDKVSFKNIKIKELP